MSLFDVTYLEKIEKFIQSGDLAFEFEHADEAKRFVILEFLEKFMDVAELVDEQATKLIFKDGYMEMLSGQSPQK